MAYNRYKNASAEEKAIDRRDLYMIAESARQRAYCPYSGISVGAALLCSSGRVYLGCNVENSAYSPGVCAERVAVLKAVSEGERTFTAIAVAGGKADQDSEGAFPPCGVCRQVLSEFCSVEFEIILKDGEDICVYRLDELLPHSFGSKNM